MSRSTTIILVVIAVVVIAFMALTFDAGVEDNRLPGADVSVTQTEEGNLPEYDVIQTEEGNLPRYEVEGEWTGGERPDADVTAPDTGMEAGMETETPTNEFPTGTDVQPAEEPQP